MIPTSAIAVSGMRAAQRSLEASAQRIATFGIDTVQGTEGERSADRLIQNRNRATAAEWPSQSIEAALIDQLRAANDFRANLAVFKTANRMLGQLLDTVG